jgi:hypothetical protein
MLSVLGEGTFLDLLAFIERHAPDETTAELVRRARQDESRHVHFRFFPRDGPPAV